MNWTKVHPNPADNDTHPERLPALDKVVLVVYLTDYDEQVITLGGRVHDGEGWLWAIYDTVYGYERGSMYDGLVADDDYRVTHWAEIEWPEG